MLWLWLAGCGSRDEVRLFAEDDGTLCIDDAVTTFTVWQDCALTCAEAEWTGRCVGTLVNDASGQPVVLLTSEILVAQPSPCREPTCGIVSVSCAVPPGGEDLPLVWGADYLQGTVAELAGDCPFEAEPTLPTLPTP